MTGVRWPRWDRKRRSEVSTGASAAVIPSESGNELQRGWPSGPLLLRLHVPALGLCLREPHLRLALKLEELRAAAHVDAEAAVLIELTVLQMLPHRIRWDGLVGT